MKKINFNKVKKGLKKKKEDLEIKKTNKKHKVVSEKPKKRKRKSRLLYWLLVLVVIFALICFLGGIGFCYYIVKSAPEFNAEKMFEKEATRIFDADNNIIATLGTEQREKITYDEIPEVLVDAIIATEDSRFFQHNGFDAPRFLKASIQQIMGAGGGGASTLTMQLSKLAFTTTESSGIKGIIRKFTDIYMSVFKIEKNFTKEEILEYYVNTPCLGGSIYGVEQASIYYFGKSAQDLNLVEAAMIAGMFQSPNGYNPYVNPNDANDRKNTVLYLMKRHGYITQTEYDAGVSVKIKDLVKEGTTSTNEYQGFIDTVVQEVIDKTGNNPYDVPMDIYTTMIKSKQDGINKFYKSWKFKDKKVEVGIGVIDTNTGAIVAVGAGRYKTSAMTLNVATFHGQTKRMPGSTIKPIMDYGPAIEYENLSTYGPFIDEKTKYGSGYIRNFSGTYSGFMTMQKCLSQSINTCALQAFNMTTSEQKYKFATSLGIELDTKNLPQSYSIGAFNGVSPVQLAGAYAAFANGGYYTEPYSFTKIVYTETDKEYIPDISRTRVMKVSTATMITNVLKTATVSYVKVSGTQIATKTGTTSYDSSILEKYGLPSSIIPDSWTSSYTANYAMAIWYGYTDTLTSETVKKKWYLNNNSASTERLKIQAYLAKKIYDKNTKFKNYGGLTTASVELETIPAQSPSAYTPSSLKGTFTFVKGTEPSETSTRFSKLTAPSNVTHTQSDKTLTISWDAVATPSAVDTTYLKEYFEKGYTDWADKYYKKRLSYNKKNIGNFGYAVYLTQGTSSKYVGWTSNTSYTIDLSKYTGTYDGVIVKSMYSIFKSNASDGTKILFSINNTQSTYTITPTTSNLVLNVGDTYNELTIAAIDDIKLNESSIINDVEDLTITADSNAKNSSNENVSLDNITTTAGTYTLNYTVSYKYNGTTQTHKIKQTISVKDA